METNPMKHITSLTQMKMPITAENGADGALSPDAIKETLRKLLCGTSKGKCTKDCGCGG